MAELFEPLQPVPEERDRSIPSQSPTVRSSSIIPVHSLESGDQAKQPFQFVELTPLKKGSYDYSRPHRHNYYEIFYFAKGGGEHDIDFTTLSINSPCLHFVSPGQIHQTRRHTDTESHGSVLLFTTEFYYIDLVNRNALHDMPLLHGNHPQPILNLDPEENENISGIVDRIRSEYAEQDHHSHDILRSLVNLLLLSAQRIFERREGVEYEESGDSRLLRELRKSIELNFHSIHAVSDYASMLNVSPGHLNDVTKMMSGRTVSSLIQERILLEAKRLLAHSDQSIKEIAYALGFEDPSYFTRFFRERTGGAPGIFRDSFHRQG